MGSLPPSLDRAGLKDLIVGEFAGMQADHLALLEPAIEAFVETTFAARAHPRSIMTPIAINLARIGVRAIGGDHG